MRTKVLEILKKALELETVDESITQDTCENWDSMRHLSLVIELESEFDIELEPEEIASIKSFDNILLLIREKNAQTGR